MVVRSGKGTVLPRSSTNRGPRVPATPAAFAVGVLVGALPFLGITIRDPQLGLAFETVAVLVASLAAFLTLGRFLRSGRPRDLALLASLTLLAGSNLLFGILPVLINPLGFDVVGDWAATVGVLLGSVFMAAAAWERRPEIKDPNAAAERALRAVVVTLAVIGVGVVVFQDSLARDPGWMNSLSHPAILAMQLACALFFAAAAVGFFRRAEGGGDGFLRWLEAAAVLAAFARLNYVLYPIEVRDWIYTGDLLLLGFYCLLTVAAAREIAAYWQRLAHTAQIEERRRLARDMHDGLAQELAFIARQTHVLEPLAEHNPAVQRIAGAATRALAEARRAIATLTYSDPDPLHVALEREVRDVVDRTGAVLGLRLARDAGASPRTRETFLRIAREAATNAVRHGHARSLYVELSKTRVLTLSVSDDGCGFEPQEVNGHGFGLTSMKERAESLGGEFTLSSEPGRGTRIEVVIP